MRRYNLQSIENFLKSHGWSIVGEEQLFVEYAPPKQLNLDGYSIDIPKSDKDRGFNKYINSLLDTFVDVYVDRFTKEDLATVFQTDKNLFAIKVEGHDTALGTLQLTRFRNSVNTFYQSLRQSVVYAVTHQPIFGKARSEANTYLKACRSKQTAFGSYVLKYELPENNLSLFSERSVPIVLFDAMNFLITISNELNEEDITESFVVGNSNVINVELLESLVKLYKDSRLYNATIQLDSQNYSKEFSITTDKAKIKKMERMVKDIKEILLKRIPLEVEGTIIRLASREVEETGKIVMEVEIGEEWFKLEVLLESNDYKKAVEAHKLSQEVYVKGIAQELRHKYLIEELQEFKVI